jgi:hypothetical protein
VTRVAQPGSPDDSSAAAPLPRWALFLMLPGILAPVLGLVFIVVTQAAHDPDRCPFRELTRQAVAPGVEVLEQARRCLPGVEERRYVLRRGAGTQLLGERRLRAKAFTGGYRWSASIAKASEVHVLVHNDGHRDLRFREGTPEEKAR